MEAASIPEPRPYGGVSEAERVDARRRRLLEAGLELFGTRGLRRGRRQGRLPRGRAHRPLLLRVVRRQADAVPRGVRLRSPTTCSLASPRPSCRGRARNPSRSCGPRSGRFLGALAADPRKPRLVFSEAAAAGGRGRAAHAGDAAPVQRSGRRDRRPHLPDDVAEGMVRIARALARRHARAGGDRVAAGRAPAPDRGDHPALRLGVRRGPRGARRLAGDLGLRERGRKLLEDMLPVDPAVARFARCTTGAP